MTTTETVYHLPVAQASQLKLNILVDLVRNGAGAARSSVPAIRAIPQVTARVNPALVQLVALYER